MKTISAILALCAALFAQVPPVSPNPPAGPSTGSTAPARIFATWQIKPQVITTSSAVDLCSLPGGPPCGNDVYVCWMDANTGSTPTTITIADKQGTPVKFANAVSIAANTVYAPFGPSESSESPDRVCRWFPGGLTITAGNSSALSIYMRGKWTTGPALF